MEASDLTAEDLQHAAACATKYRGLGIDDDDLEQEAYLAVCEAAKAFRPDEHPGVPFWGYAHRRVDLALKAAIGRCRDHDESCFDREPSTGPDPHAQKLENELWAAIETLPDRLRTALCRRYGLGCEPQTVQEIARSMDLGVRTVSEMLELGRRKIGEHLLAEGLHVRSGPKDAAIGAA